MLRADDSTESIFERADAVVVDDGRSRIVLNLDGVAFLASMAIGRLVTLTHKVRKAGGRLVLCKATRPIHDMLRTTHLTDVLLVYDDEQEAVRSFSPVA
jgi:anti-sigma B factor antagonist